MLDIDRIKELVSIVDSPPKDLCAKHYAAARQLEFLAVPIAREYLYLRDELQKLIDTPRKEEEHDEINLTIEIKQPNGGRHENERTKN